MAQDFDRKIKLMMMFLLAFGTLYCAVNEASALYEPNIYGARYGIHDNFTTSAYAKSINDTGLVKGHPFWAYIANSSFLYANATGFTANFSVATDTTQDLWENETSYTGNNITGLWQSAGTVATYHFSNTGTTNVIDSRGITNGTRLAGATYNSSGRFGSAIQFNATGQVNISNSVINNQNASYGVEFQIYLFSNGTAANIISFHNTTGPNFNNINVNGSNNLLIDFADGAANRITTGQSITQQKWTHVVITRQDGREIIYQDCAIIYNATRPNITGSPILRTTLGDSGGGTTNMLLDEVRFYNRTVTTQEVQNNCFNGNGNLTRFGDEELAVQNPLITISNPTNTTYYMSNNFPFTFNIQDDNSATMNVTAYIDGTLVYSNASFINNGNVTFLLNLTQIKTYNFTVQAQNMTGGNSSTSVLFTIDDFESIPISKTFDYETNNTNYTILFLTNFDVISNISSMLIWNNSLQAGSIYSATNSTHTIQRKNVTIPLLVTNNTMINWSWNYSIGYINGTFVHNRTTANLTEGLHFAYYLPANAISQNSSAYIENDDMLNTLNVTTWLQAAALTANSTFRGSNYSHVSTAYNVLDATIRIEPITNTSEVHVINSTLTITFNSQSRAVTSENDNVTIHKIILTTCGGISNTTTMNFFLKNEETDADINGTMEMLHNVSKGNFTRTFNFTFSNVTNATICLNPSFATYLLDSWIKYYAPTYSTRDYFLFQNISNQTSNITLYLLSEAVSSDVIFVLRDKNNNAVPNAIIKIQRFFVGQNVYKTVAQVKTDDPIGKGVTFLRVIDVDYRYIVEQNQSVTLTTTPTKIVCEAPLNDPLISIDTCPPYPQKIVLGESPVALYFQITDEIAHDCNDEAILNGSTTLFRCDVIDTTGLMHLSRLVVQKKGAIEWSTICDTNASSSAATHTCELGNTTGALYRYQLLGSFSDPPRVFEANTFDFATGIIAWGAMGIFMAMLLVLGMFMLHNHPVIQMGLGVVAIVMGWYMSFIPVVVVGVVSLVISTLILIFGTRS